MNKSLALAVIGTATLVALLFAGRQCRGPQLSGEEVLTLRQRLPEGAKGAGLREARRRGLGPRAGSDRRGSSADAGTGRRAVPGTREGSSKGRSSGRKTLAPSGRSGKHDGVRQAWEAQSAELRAAIEARANALPFDDPEIRARLSGGHGGLGGRSVADDLTDETVVSDPEERGDLEAPVLSLFDGADLAGFPVQVADGVSLDEEGAARFNPDSEFAISAANYVDGAAGTISFWVEPAEVSEAASEGESLLQLRSQHVWENRVQIWKDGGAIRLVFADNLGIESGAAYEEGEWLPGEPRLITMTWGDGRNALWVNGELAGESEYEGELQILPDTLLHIGSNYREDSASVSGVIRRFQVFNRQFDAEEVGRLVEQRSD